MRSLPDISAAEWDVMKVVWAHGPITSGQVVRRLAAQRRWKPRTIKTLLARLVQKQAVSMTSEHGRFLYRAKVARELLARREARSFLARVFDGALAPALMHLVDEVDLSPEQIDELKQILDRETRR